MRISLFFLILFCSACGGENSTPKPVGYFRIDLPKSEYKEKNFACPFKFDISTQSRLEFSQETIEKCWFDITYPSYKARIHMTYKPVENNLRSLLEESRTLAYEHQIKASRIETRVINHPEKEVYGLVYDLGGSVASPYQFYLTDSTNHFIRGSLYFRTRPNPDSLNPVLNYVKEDMEHFIDSFQWKK